MSNALIGFIRGLGLVIFLAILSYLANAANLSGLVNPTTGGLIAVIALTVEHALSPAGTAIMGFVGKRS